MLATISQTGLPTINQLLTSADLPQSNKMRRIVDAFIGGKDRETRLEKIAKMETYIGNVKRKLLDRSRNDNEGLVSLLVSANKFRLAMYNTEGIPIPVDSESAGTRIAGEREG